MIHFGMMLDQMVHEKLYIAGLFDYGIVSSTIKEGYYLSNLSDLTTSQFNLGFIIPEVLTNQDILSFNISQPLKIESGYSNLNLPGLKDENGNLSHKTALIPLEPSSREINLDLGYERSFLNNSSMRVGTQIKINPFHSSENDTYNSFYGIYGIQF